jgi:hypothetical protein
VESSGTVETGCGKIWKWLCKAALEKSLWGAAARPWVCGRGRGNGVPRCGRPWKAAVSIDCGKRLWKGLAVAVQRSGKGRGGPLRGQVTLIWHNFCLGNAYPMICKWLVNGLLTLS